MTGGSKKEENSIFSVFSVGVSNITQKLFHNRD